MPVPGLSGTHQWNGGPTLHDLTVWPHVRLTSIAGLGSLPELEDQRDLLTGKFGEKPRKSVSRGKLIVYSGVVRAQSRSSLESFRSTLLGAYAMRDARMRVASKFGGAAYYFDGRVMACDIPEEHPDDDAIRRVTYGHERSFTLGVRLPDPRFYVETGKSANTSAVTSDTGTSLAWIFPVVIAGPSAASGSANVVNAGTAPTDPIIDLHGPISTSPVGIVNQTINRAIYLDLTIASTDYVRINFATRQIMLNGVTDVGYALNRTLSNWWDNNIPGLPYGMSGLVPGNNSIRFTAPGLADPAYAAISFNDADWG